MKQVGGVWLPDHETHLVEWMTKKNQVVDGKLTYQLDKQNAAYSFCRQFRHAIDIGAHCGLWSMQMAKRFRVLDAFEPVAEHRECFKANVGAGLWRDHISGEHKIADISDPDCAAQLYPWALGEKRGSVRMETAPTSSGDTRIGGAGDIPLCTLDDTRLTANDVDFIKLDCEGYELFALRGGEQLIRRCMPVICVEQKPGRGQRFGLPERGAIEYLQGLGYKLAREMSGDFIMVPA
jgi:hypothetical protein